MFRFWFRCVCLASVCTLLHGPCWAQVATTLEDFLLPGSQPGQSGNLEHPSKCDNCHGGYDLAVEPAFNWRGSMMAQAARDPLFYACLTIANQDAPESGDLCIRCHSPAGWLEGRSSPTDGSALNNNDREGVQCDFCHKLVNPDALDGNPYPWADPMYEVDTWPQDVDYLLSLDPLLRPLTHANGMYVADSANAKRGPFWDAEARHQMMYSPFHSDAALCGTCHDVSNPVYARQEDGSYAPNAMGAPADTFDPQQMFPVERTYSEWLNSKWAAEGVTCQICHMRRVSGYGCNKAGVPYRDGTLPLHDLTGGNTAMQELVKLLYPDEVDTAALAAGQERARQMLQFAADMDLTVATDPTNNTLTAKVVVTNQTGHKLPSGYPEGRRIWINLRAYSGSTLVYESGAYDPATGELNTSGAKVYEIKPGLSNVLAGKLGLDPGPSFHFALNNQIFEDNRIPPRGFTNATFEEIQSPPVNYSYEDGQYWDTTEYTLQATYVTSETEFVVDRVEATLYYQATSKEYVEFLRDENRTNQWGQVLYDLWSTNGKSPPEVMATDVEYPYGPPADTEPPSAPTGLSARSLSSSEIAVSWDPSTDNVGVRDYTVFRNGFAVTTTTQTTHTDSNLLPSTTYEYYVTTADDANNISEPSIPVTATTQRQKGGGKPSK